MNNREEKLIEPTRQAVQRAWRFSSRRKYYSEEPASKEDMQSVDRVWGRLTEHISRNSAAYQENRNIQGEQPYQQGWIQHHQSQPRWSGLRRGLASVAAVLALVLITGSLLLVLHATRQMTTTSTAPVSAQAMPPAKNFLQGQQASISIVQANGIIAFQVSRKVVAVSESIMLLNFTDREQVVSSDDNQVLSLTPYKGISQLSFQKPGLHSLSLANNATIQTSISVVDTRITIAPAGPLASAILKPATLKLPADVPIVWSNETSQGQAMVSDSSNCTPIIKIPPYQQVAGIFCTATGSYNFHLQDNDKANVTVILLN